MELKTEDYSTHISQQFNEELEQIRTQLLTMGGVVERQVHDCIDALLNGDAELAEQSRRVDKQTNEMEVLIDEQCTTIIARRQPAASDLRLIIAVSKAVSDLEGMGDEASRICRHAIELVEEGSSPRGYQEVRHIGNLVREMVKDVLTAFARNDTELAYRVAKMDKSVDQEYRSAMRSLATFMMEDPRSISSVMNVIWVLRSLERISEHARAMATHLIYLVSGTDVRHGSLKQIKRAVNPDTDEQE
ncbi:MULTISPECIES: phosphate signaling complex protein PhoU [unclassified Neptuniibacter]|jgi:phosphate transport system protein|uniref:phosphate signaling complex protein PhoU n=1 Tax=unclassified Neptuniibacter TaxID=2630693 RepID=UPI0026E3D15A|nr:MULTISPECIES: phosphate signaling complex protein PhoU [unclassified Neptuniibacter]MDO6513988.1 phosphate signaling complex protein PhoU [Neptuniibacter sp. 2_MG-2023]MDO6594170.1 phosphate signaling complex protein PhoU [Neptuniibacter sp. 1_MG-2023]